MHRITRTSLLLVILVLPLLASSAAVAVAPGTGAFYRTWARTDKPVDDGLVQRTWMWGPEALTGVLTEAYADAPGGERSVQYFDKSRMEDNAYRGSDPWDVTNGLLVIEMVEGYVQTGDNAYDEAPDPAEVNIVGDAGERPTYADIADLDLRDAPAMDIGSTIITTYTDDNTIETDDTYANAGVTAAHYVEMTRHTVASVFWDFMQSEGLVEQDGMTTTTRLFLDPFYATGLPITEAYWSIVSVGEVERAVLWQCFERRCLTYTPTNDPTWQVEAGNVGQHYYAWRYETQPPPPEIVTFDGQSLHYYNVGSDIPPGTYRNYPGRVEDCSWERVTADGSRVGGYFLLPSLIVTILPTDLIFHTKYCETWTSDLSPITASPTTPFADGMYLVGTDIAPGTWINDPGGRCQWARLSGFTHQPGDIIQSGGGIDRTPITILPTDAGFITDGCGSWTMR